MAITNRRCAKYVGWLRACLSVVAMLGVVSACASISAVDHPIPAHPGAEPNYANPINGATVSIAEAARRVGFQIHELSGDSVPRRLL